MTKKIDDIVMGLFSTLSRVNMLMVSLPYYVQEDMDDVKMDIVSTLRSLGCNVSMGNNDRMIMIDMVTMYKELNNISNDLSNYMLMISDIGKDSSQLEDSVFSISLIIKTISENDSVFRCCYDNAKKRVLK